MSDIVVSFALESLRDLLIHEVDLLRGVKEQVDLLKDDLGFMNSFLKDSEGKQNEHYTVKELISQIRDAAFEAEDVVSIYMAQVIKQQRRNLLQKLFHSFGHATMLHDVASERTRIKNKIDNIYTNKSRYGIEAGSHSHLDEEAERLLERRRRDVAEVDVVGFANDTTTLVHQLTHGSLQLEVTSIIGMGGLGKTTLARKIYNDSRIKNHFDCCAWVNVSQEYKTRRLLLDMMKCFMSLSDEIHQKSDEELKHTLRDNLKGKRYFVAMDDVWKPEVWDEIKVAFPDESKRSRLLITSREKAVATHASSTPPYFLPFLDKEASWELFCKKVFRGEKCPSYLESLGRQLAESCKGLPLSIVVLGGILANRDKTHQIWSSFAGNVSRFLFEDRNTCFDILALSYNQLPRRLKLCLLYVGVFPEDFEIPARHLTQLWVAEGFIPVQNGIDRKLEEDMGIAELYLAELIDRSLIQVAGRRIDGGVKTCRIHDLLRDFCINVSMEQKLFEVHADADLLSSSSSNNTTIIKARRLSFQGNISHSTPSATLDSLSARSVLSFHLIEGYNPVKYLKWILKHFRFIRVLSLEKFDIDDFIMPKGIEKLIFLRHLRISSSDYNPVSVKSIPSSICKLSYLETIHIRGYVEKPLPKSIWMMKQLRHLNVTHGMKLSNPWSRTITLLGGDDHALSNLQVLSNLRAGRTTELLFTKSSLFPNLRKLHLAGGYRKYYEVSKILASLQGSNNFQNLQTLKLARLSFGHALDLFPSVLTKITFMKCPLDSDHFKNLGKLPNLRILKINLWPLDELHTLSVKAGEFPQLEAFRMIECLPLRRWEMEMDAMPNLQRLVIKECGYLGNLPHQLWSLTHLRLVEVSGRISPGLNKELRELKMKDGCKLIIS